MTQILSDPQKLNLFFSALAVVVGLIIYWVWRPELFKLHPFSERAFEFWLLRWISAAIAWGFVAASTDKRFVLAAVDLGTILGLGFVIAMWKGESFDSRPAHTNLLLLYGLLLSWNFVMNPIIGSTAVWVSPSMSASLIVIGLMAATMVVRCRSQAVMFVLVSVGYLFLLMPTYSAVFGVSGPHSALLVQWLGFAKIFYAGLFYTLFPSGVKEFDPIAMPRFSLSNDRLWKSLSWAGITAGGVVLTQLVLWIVKVIAHMAGGNNLG